MKKETLEKFYAKSSDHYFMERVNLESAARLLVWKLDMGCKAEDIGPFLEDMRTVLGKLELFSDMRERVAAETIVNKPRLHLLACGKSGPAFESEVPNEN